MVELGKRHELNQKFASGLKNLIERQTPPSPEPLTDPDNSFIALLLNMQNVFASYSLDEQSGKYALFGAPEVENAPLHLDRILRYRITAASESKWFDKNTVLAPDADYDEVSYAALSTVRKAWINDYDHPTRRFNGLMVAAFIAAVNLPEDYNSPVKPKKHKGETVKDALFRKAMGIIFDLKERCINKEYREYVRIADELEWDSDRMDAHLAPPGNENLHRGHLDATLFSFANALITRFASNNFNPATFSEEGYEYRRWIHENRESNEAITEPPVKETTWTILPPGTMEELAKGPVKGASTGKYEGAQFVDPERMQWLAELALSWSPDAYIAVSNLKATGDYEYRAAILPQVINGMNVEHAVAENPASKNAIYVFRAERGIDDDGSVWLTWEDALKDNRTAAKMLGARKIVHNQYVKENVTEYLTRKVENLDKVGYRR